MRGIGLLIAVGLAVFSPVAKAVGADGLDPIRVQLKWLHQFQFAGYYAAQEKGYYREAGLEVKLLEGRAELDPAHAVLNGDAEFGVGTPDLLLLRAKGEPIVVLGVIFQHSPYVFLETGNSHISNIGDFIGKKVMIEPQAAELYALLMREQISTNQIQVLPHTFSPTDLTTGAVDVMSAYSTDEPFALHAAGISYATFTPRSAGIDFYGDCFFTTEKQVADHGARTRAFYEATVRGWTYAMDHPEEMIDLLLTKYHSRKSREALEFEAAEMRKLIHPELIPIGYMYRGRWEHIMETYEELGMLKEPVSLKGFLYDSRPHHDATWLYWLSGAALAVAALALGFLLPMWRLNGRLRVAKERAEAADRAKARFVSIVSHELRTPMNGVIGFASLLRRTPLAPEQDEYVDLINQSAESITRLVDDLLDLAKIEAGKIEVNPSTFSLPELVSEVTRFFTPVAVQKTLALNYRLGEGVPEFVTADRLRLRQVLLNIMGNSCKFTDLGSVTLTVSAEATPEQWVEFVIQDTGPGMTPEAVGRIFEPFAQGDATVQERFGGTGLGLAISRDLTSLLGGSLKISSSPGVGTTTRCRLPMARAEGPQREPNPASVHAPSGQKILVAEDDVISAKLMKSLLVRAGYDPVVANNGQQAVEAWRRDLPELIFMDLHMPGLDGLAAIAKIREEEKQRATSRRTVIIALTAEAAPVVREECVAAGADDYLSKPVSLEKIESALEQVPRRNG